MLLAFAPGSSIAIIPNTDNGPRSHRSQSPQSQQRQRFAQKGHSGECRYNRDKSHQQGYCLGPKAAHCEGIEQQHAHTAVPRDKNEACPDAYRKENRNPAATGTGCCVRRIKHCQGSSIKRLLETPIGAAMLRSSGKICLEPRKEKAVMAVRILSMKSLNLSWITCCHGTGKIRYQVS